MTTSKNDKWLDFSELYTCPYCGSRKKLREYEIIKNQDGRIRQIICSICNETMRKNTLINDITPYQWGEWLYLNIRIYNSHFYKFHDKIHMDLLVENLRISPDLANCFWDGWFHAKDEWNKGTGNRLLTEIEDKMYPKKKISRLNGFFSGKSINSQTNRALPDTFDDLQQKGQDQKNSEVAQKGIIGNNGEGSRDSHTYSTPRKCTDISTEHQGES